MNHANARQVGGDHYRSAFQHWDFVPMYGLGYYEGQITKYVSRHAKKKGLEDVSKAIHFAEKLAELANAGMVLPVHVIAEPTIDGGLDPAIGTVSEQFCRANDLGQDESMVVKAMCRWHSPRDLQRILSVLHAIAAKYTSQDTGDQPTRRYVDQADDFKPDRDMPVGHHPV